MLLPYLQNSKKKSKEYIIGFLGMNLGEGNKEGEFSETLNLSSSAYPCLTQRPAREVYKTLTAPSALYARGNMCYVDGTTFYYNGEPAGEVTAGEKQFATINTRIIIWPDKICYDTVSGTMTGLSLSLTRAVTFAQVQTPASTTITTSGDAFTCKKGDGVKISGCTSVTANNDITAIIRDISEDGRTLTFDAEVFSVGSETQAVLAREIPDMDFICEWNNRLWGCADSMIYASALGDPFNFNVFDNISTDSYAVSVGSDGKFTGITGYSTHLMFHKEYLVHKIYGSKPANYDMVTGNFQGIMTGCHKSAVIINEILYYMSRQGVMTYTGSIAYSVSSAFGEKKFSDAVAGSDGEKYYISMQDGYGSWGLFVYDTKHSLWLREDSTHVIDFAFIGGRLYFLSSDKNIYFIGYGSETINWSATLCRLDETITEVKGYSRLTMRAELEAGSSINVEVAADGGAFETVKTVSAGAGCREISVIPIIPTRCDSFRIRLSGKGRSRIYALTREFNTGSELR